MILSSRFFSLTILALSLAAAPAQAQALRTWVSQAGDDVNPCSRPSPCKTFTGAMSKTAAGGDITVLDSGGYSPVTITKSISITNGGGPVALILAPTGAAITVRAGPQDVVRIRGLSLDGSGGTQAAAGIRFESGGELHVENSFIRNFRLASDGYGIDFAPSTSAVLYVSDTTVTRNVAGGIRIKPSGAGTTTRTVLNRVQVYSNGFGVRADGTTSTGSVYLSVRDSVMATNDTNGLWAASTASGAALIVESDRNLIVNSQAAGVVADGAKAGIVLANTTVMGNLIGLQSLNGGGLFSFKNNNISNNLAMSDPIPPGNILPQQ